MENLIFIFSFFLLWQSRRSNNSAATIIITVLIIGFVLLLVIGMIVFITLRKKKRIQGLQLFAAQNGWQLVPNANINFFQNPDNYQLFASGRLKEVACLIQKQFGSGEIFVFEYSYITGYGKSQKTYTQTVVGFRSPRLNLPYFSLYPENFLSFVGEAFGYNDIDFASHPHFSKQYKLVGGNEMAVRQMFNPQMLSYFESLPTVNIDGGGNYIFIYELNKTASAENLNWYVGERMKFINPFAG